MRKQTINFWILFTVSTILSAIAISLFFKALKVILMVVLILALTPIIYLILRLIFPTKKDEDDKLRKRD
ncbi:hypothetical protein POKO110462_08850 [Pontibacter korlensis]|uniref:Uncharacterized protein n=1 Tax=Pontibacter korlensis TaxID=400092 RepID=A0A0E3ZCR4_9BACT|nr:hypothetical protein [Pontibacter korlensis]AKD02604.1 hypothetical protein PKOR_05050 [Pontibacter korlensis]